MFPVKRFGDSLPRGKTAPKTEAAVFAALRETAWEIPLVRRADLALLSDRLTRLMPNGVAYGLSLNR